MPSLLPGPLSESTLPAAPSLSARAPPGPHSAPGGLLLPFHMLVCLGIKCEMGDDAVDVPTYEGEAAPVFQTAEEATPLCWKSPLHPFILIVTLFLSLSFFVSCISPITI